MLSIEGELFECEAVRLELPEGVDVSTSPVRVFVQVRGYGDCANMLTPEEARRAAAAILAAADEAEEVRCDD